MSGTMKEAKEIARHLYNLFERHSHGDQSRIVDGFVSFLRAERFLGHAGKIIAEFETYAHEREKKQVVVIESTKPLALEIKKSIAADMHAALGRELILEEKVRPELIGGIRLRVGDKIVDASIKRKLKQIFES